MVLIHIGYHKTGSTWLQRHLFNTGTGFSTPVNKHVARQKIVEPNALDYDVETTRMFFESAFEVAIEHGQVPVISCERICGSPHGGGYDSKEIADRLFETFPKAKILIVIRQQQAMILSTYNQ